MGELRVRKRGKVWEWSFETARVNGKRTSERKSGYATKAEAVRAGTAVKAQYDLAGQALQKDLSYADYLNTIWIPDFVDSQLAVLTAYHYKCLIRKHIEPVLGNYKINQISPIHVQRLLTRLFNEGYSKGSLQNIKNIISGSFKYGIRMLDWTISNPGDKAQLPSDGAVPEKAPYKPRLSQNLTDKEVQIILQTYKEGSIQYLILQLATWAGLRQGEISGLTWNNVDFENHTLNICQQLVFLSPRQYILKKPKYNSSRIITVDSYLIELLKAHRNMQLQNQKLYGQYYTRYQLSEGNKLMHSTNIDTNEVDLVMRYENGKCVLAQYITFSKIKKQIPHFTLHKLRHFYATKLIEGGANIKDVQKRLGHKTLEMTMNIYVDYTDYMKDFSTQLLETMRKDAQSNERK